MITNPDDSDDETLSFMAASGDRDALDVLLSRNRNRLKTMVVLRMPPQLHHRVDGSDVIQEAYLQAARNVAGYVHDPNRPFYFWIRKIVENKLSEVTRTHLCAEKRSISRESSPSVSSASLAGFFVDSSRSGPLNKIMLRELQQLIREELESMQEADREVLTLRHYEQLSLSEIAEILGLSKSGVAKRYRQAIKRLRSVIERFPGLL